MTRLSSYAWPGNIRELRNVVERLLLLSPTRSSDPISADELTHILPQAVAQPSAGAETPVADADSLEAAERTHILYVLAKHQGNKTQTARASTPSSRGTISDC